jgi:hypothetical protein
MSKTDHIRPDQAERPLQDHELDAVTGGMDPFARLGDIKGETTEKSRGSYSKTLTFTLSTTSP